MSEQGQDPFRAPELDVAAAEGGFRAIHLPGDTGPFAFRFEVDHYGAPADLSLTRDEAERLAVWLRCRLDMGG